MAYGDSPDDEPLKTAWDAFCERLKQAGERVFKDSIPARPLERAAGFRLLTQSLAMAFEWGLENRTLRHPYLRPEFSPTRKQAGDNADCLYLVSWLDPRETYRIVGNIGHVKFINITVQGEWIGTLPDPLGDVPEASLLGHQVQTEWDGSFVLWLSQTKHEGNWLPLTPKSRRVLLRQFFEDWEHEEPMTVRLECVGVEGPPAPFGPQELIASMRWAGDFMYNTADAWPDMLFDREHALDHPNEFRVSGYDPKRDTVRGRAMLSAYWRLAEDEALIIEFAQPSWFWSIHVENIWWQTVDYEWRPGSINSHTAVPDENGVMRVVIAHQDPGVANWLDTSGFVSGHLNFRNMLVPQAPDVRTTVVKFAELEQTLPPETPRVTPEERRQQIEKRRIGVRRRFRQ